MPHIALRPLKIQVIDEGGKRSIEMRQPGEPVPEAVGWNNPGVWIRRGDITDADGFVCRGGKRTGQRLEMGPKLTGDLIMQDGAVPDAADAAADELGPDEPETLDDDDLDDEPAAPGEETKPGGHTEEGLLGLTKSELIALACEFDLALSSRTRKDEMVDAIMEAQG